MKRMVIQYRVKADRAAENEAAIRKVFDQLRREAPPGIRYVSFKQEDGVTFVHMVSIETPDLSNPLQSLEAFKEFAARVKDRCEDGPVTHELHEVGSYRVFSG